MSNQIIERLSDTAHTFRNALDLGCHTGTLAHLLKAHAPDMHIRACDLSEAMIRQASAEGIEAVILDEEAILTGPNAPGQGEFDLVTSALSLHWANDLPGALAQIRASLQPDGLFLGALLGAGTLPELRYALSEAESELVGGAGARLSPLPRLQDIASLMQRAGFALPVVDLDKLTVHYSSPFKLLDDLGGMAERASFAAPASRGLSRRILARMAEIYFEEFADERGKVPATFNIIHMSGWAPAPHQPQPKRRGSATISLAEGIAKTRDAAPLPDGST